MDKTHIADIELDLLLEGVYRRWGYDFRQYARGSLRRRVGLACEELGAGTMAELQHRVLHERASFDRLALSLSVSVTELFRDPGFFRAMRETVLPLLASYPFIKVWHAGCATGEEVYSMAILFDEAGLLDRTTFYGTDFNSASLDTARDGIYPLEQLEKSAESYTAAGGQRRLAGYAATAHASARFNKRLRDRIVFSLHNLAVDGVFSEIHLVVCRNVLIYFNNELKERVVDLFAGALVPFGVLALGGKESLGVTPADRHFKVLDAPHRLYRKEG